MPYNPGIFVIKNPLDLANVITMYDFLVSQGRIPMGAVNPDGFKQVLTKRGGASLIYAMGEGGIITGGLVGSFAYDNMGLQGEEGKIYYLIGRVKEGYRRHGLMKAMIEQIKPIAKRKRCTHLGVAERVGVSEVALFSNLGFVDFWHGMDSTRSKELEELLTKLDEPITEERTRLVMKL